MEEEIFLFFETPDIMSVGGSKVLKDLRIAGLLPYLCYRTHKAVLILCNLRDKISKKGDRVTEIFSVMYFTRSASPTGGARVIKGPPVSLAPKDIV